MGAGEEVMRLRSRCSRSPLRVRRSLGKLNIVIGIEAVVVEEDAGARMKMDVVGTNLLLRGGRGGWTALVPLETDGQ